MGSWHQHLKQKSQYSVNDYQYGLIPNTSPVCIARVLVHLDSTIFPRLWQMHALDTLVIRNPSDQSTAPIANTFYIQLIFPFHDATARCVGRRVQLLRRPFPTPNAKPHALQDAGGQSLK